MPYIDAQDIRQHLRGAQNVPVSNINEIMEEMEDFVSVRLDLNPLPDGNNILKNLIRELTSSRVILDLLPPTADNLAKSAMHEQRGFKLLAEAKANGIAPVDFSLKHPENEVYVPPEYPAWTALDFQP